jgi:hypothetical protein
MKKLILISAIAATTLFADGFADMAKKVAVDHAKSEANKKVNSEIKKVSTTKEETTKKEVVKEEKTDTSSSLKDAAIDVAADQAHAKVGVDKGIAKEAIKTVVK